MESKKVFTFLGKVSPEHDPPQAVSAHIALSDQGISFRALITIVSSGVAVHMTDVEGTEDISTLRNYAQLVASYVVDGWGYTVGKSYSVEMVRLLLPEGMRIEGETEALFGAGIEELMNSRNERPLEFGPLWTLILQSGYLRRALADLREAVRGDTGFYCYRAVESIRQSFKELEDKNEAKSWERLREALRIDRGWIDSIRRFADDRRHGGIRGMSGDERVLTMQRAWKIVDRYVMYLQRGSEPLPENEVELLQE